MTLVALVLLAAGGAGAEELQTGFELYDLEGKLYSLERVRAEAGVRVIVVDFFWDGCEPCKKALEKWKVLYRKHEARGLRMVVVDVRAGDDLATAKRKLQDYFAKHPVPFPVVFDKYNMVARQYGVASADGNTVSLPQVFILDGKGRLLLKTADSEKAAKKIEKTFE